MDTSSEVEIRRGHYHLVSAQMRIEVRKRVGHVGYVQAAVLQIYADSRRWPARCPPTVDIQPILDDLLFHSGEHLIALQASDVEMLEVCSNERTGQDFPTRTNANLLNIAR